MVCRGEADPVEHRFDLWVGHEQLPDQSGAIVLDHYGNWSLVESHINGRKPIAAFVEGVYRPVNSPRTVPQVTIEVLECRHRRFRRVRKRSECASGSHGAIIVL